MIVFRVDANEQVATGHLMRTLSIASACRKCGLMCEFWLAEEKETERIAKAGFPYRILQKPSKLLQRCIRICQTRKGDVF